MRTQVHLRRLSRALVLAPVVLLAWAATPPVTNLPAGYSRHVWHAEDGLPEETVQAFAQTPDRFLWIGTSGGLVRFDGSQFTVFNRDNTPAFGDSSVFSLLVSADGTLWIGTEGGGLLAYSGRKFRAWSKADGLTNGYVRALLQDHAGDLWIGTDDGFFRLRRGVIERIDGRGTVPPVSVHAIYEDRQQRLWFGGFHLFMKEGGTTHEVILPGGPTDNIKSILQTSDGTVWVGRVSGLARAVPGPGRPRFERVCGIHSTVRTLLEDADGGLLAGTIGEGLLQYRQAKWTTFAAAPSLPSNTVLSTSIGAERSVWIGTQTGLVRLNKTTVSTLPLPDFADADFGTVYRDVDDSLWMGSSHLFHLVRGRVEIAHLPAALAGARVRTVFRDSHGQLWLGTEGKGAFRVHAGVAEAIPAMQPYIRAFAEDHTGGIWIGTDGGYIRWTPDRTTYFELHESVRAILVDQAGNVWVGKDRGLTLLRQPNFTAAVPISRLAKEKVWAIHQDDSGAMWFGTRSSGLFRWKDGALTSFTTAQGLASNSIYQILQDRHGTLWISGANQILSVKLKDLEKVARDPGYHPAIRLYGTSDGLETTQMYGGVQPAGCITEDGYAWFPSTAGPVRAGLDAAAGNLVPRAAIYDVVADGRQIPAAGTIDIKPGEGKLDIQYGAVELRSPERVRFRYELDGFDHQWTETRARIASYTNIPPGHYTFRLQAFDIDQPQAASLAGAALVWRPHVYQTRWFFLALSITLCLLSWGTYRWRMQQVRARFDAVLEERNRLAREMHDTLIQGCTSTSALLEAVAAMRENQQDAKDELLDHARLQVRALADESRRTVWNLRQRTADTPDLTKLLELMAQQAGEGLNATVQLERIGVRVALDALVEHDLVMVAREAVHNALKHAHPHQVRVLVSFQPAAVQLEVSDDGCGFNVDEARIRNPEHFGLIGMRERTARLGGEFRVDSLPGQGTIVTIRVPLRTRFPHTGQRARWLRFVPGKRQTLV